MGTAGLDVFVFEPSDKATFHVQAKLTDEFSEPTEDLEANNKVIRASYDELTAQFHLNHQSTTAEKLNLTVYWYAHQMLVHYASPHGLEQYSGAAWGTRDVSQGPFEFFLATGNKAVLRKLVLTIFLINIKILGIGHNGLCLINIHRFSKKKAMAMLLFGL